MQSLFSSLLLTLLRKTAENKSNILSTRDFTSSVFFQIKVLVEIMIVCMKCLLKIRLALHRQNHNQKFLRIFKIDKNAWSKSNIVA